MTKSSTNDEALVRTLAELLNENGLTEIKYEKDGLKLMLSKTVQMVAAAPMAAPVAAAAPALAADAPVTAPASGEVDANNPAILKSPMVGMVYTSASPDVADFVKVGDTVTEGQTVLLVEAMKVFNPILAHKAGKISQIFISNGSPVEYDEPMLLIE